MKSLVKRFFPFLNWFPMKSVQVRADLLAGLTVALVLIPQSMAYAQLAGLPPYYGLYAAFLPVLVGALWGSSQQLATGPVAVVALLTASALAPLAVAGSERYIALAILLALLVGLIQITLGAFRLGAIVNLLSHPVIIGFTNAAAIIIGLSQLNKLLGVPMTRSDKFLNDITGVFAQIGDTHLPTLFMGLAALVIMLLLKRFLPKWPNVLIAVVLTTLVSWQIGFERDMQLPLDAVRDAALHAEVVEYRAVQQRILVLDQAIADERARYAQAGKEYSPAEFATMEYGLHLAVLEYEQTAQENSDRFQRLRSQHYVISAGPDGRSLLPAVKPGQTEVQWRIKKIDDKGLHLAGGGEVVGAIPPGLPSLSIPRLAWNDIVSLLTAALVISLVAFMEAISIAKAMAARTRARIDPDQELIGQGLANIVGSASQAFPGSGSFSRSAVNLDAGAVTGLASVFSGVLVLITLLFLTSMLYHLPQAVLAAVIMLAVSGLINFKAIWHAWQTKHHDGIAAMITFGATLAFAPHLDVGILFGTAVAVSLFLLRRMRPRAEILGQHPDGVLAGMDTHGLQPISDVFVPVRFDGELTFVNVAYFEDMVLEALARFPNARAILVIGSGINEIDVSGEEKVRALAERLAKVGVTLYLSGLKRQVMEVLERAHISEVIPPERMFKSKDQALQILMARYGATGADAAASGAKG
ncbi:MAG: SulP family inorganic anion transporter [Rhodocyclaceae bacterium]|nr:SulP family inorganic anion transporter [Rhodocyclaceae bacterium]